MNRSEVFWIQVRCVVLMLLGFAIVGFVGVRFSKNPSGLCQRVRPNPKMIWSDAVYEAKQANDTELLIAFFHSKIPEARRIAARSLDRAEPSEKMFDLWSQELADPDPELQYVGALSLHFSVKKLHYKSRDLPVMPGWQHFNENPDEYINTWRAWWQENRETVIARSRGGANSTAVPRELKIP